MGSIKAHLPYINLNLDIGAPRESPTMGPYNPPKGSKGVNESTYNIICCFPSMEPSGRLLERRGIGQKRPLPLHLPRHTNKFGGDIGVSSVEFISTFFRYTMLHACVALLLDGRISTITSHFFCPSNVNNLVIL